MVESLRMLQAPPTLTSPPLLPPAAQSVTGRRPVFRVDGGSAAENLALQNIQVCELHVRGGQVGCRESSPPRLLSPSSSSS